MIFYKKGIVTTRGDWNVIKCRVNPNHKNAPDNQHKKINATINQLEKINREFNDYRLLNNIPVTEQAIKNILKGIDPISGKKSANRPETTFEEAFQKWLDYTEKHNELGTYRKRKTVHKFYEDFQKGTGTEMQNTWGML